MAATARLRGAGGEFGVYNAHASIALKVEWLFAGHQKRFAQKRASIQAHIPSVVDEVAGSRRRGPVPQFRGTPATDANSKQTTFAYDSMDRLTKITYPDTTTTQFGYDYRGRRTTVTDQNSKVTTYAYDDADRLITVTDAGTNVTTYGYDTENNLTSIKDANNNTTSFTYDAYGRVTQTNFPSSHIEMYGYDNVGNLTSKTDRKNQLITYTYDQLNRLTQKSYPDTTAVNYTYDNDSRLTQVSDRTGTYGFTFDNMGRLSATTTNYAFLTGRSFTTAYAYDAASNRTGFTDPENGSTTYVYDTLNRLQTLTPPSAFTSGSFGFGYDVLSRRTSLTRPNSVSTTYGYDNLSRLLSVTHAKSGTTLDGASYGLDNAGNRTSRTPLPGTTATNFTYDNIYELLTATQGATTTESYTYDPVGNRLSNLAGSGWTNNTSNELTARPGISYTYDNNGNTLTKTDTTGTTNYSWDYDNRLTSATLPGSGGTVSYGYDPFGRRIYKSSSSGTSIYAYDAANVVEETNSIGAVTARYTQGQDIDEPLAELRSATTSYYQVDGLGSVTTLTNPAGAVAGNYTYDSFGNLVASSGSIVNNFRYTGREFDSETNLYYYRARYFDPITGRFLSEDPLEFDGGIDFYVYTQNDPVGLVDPSGMQPGPDSNGFWPANLNDPELAPLIVWPYPSSKKFYGVNQECVSLTRKFTGLPCSDCWRPGPKVIGNTIPAGTAIATFDQDHRYPQQDGVAKNSGIYVKSFPGNAILIVDQWGPHPGSPAHPAKARVLNPSPGDTSNDSGSYSVITVPRGTTSKKCKCGNW